MDEFIIDLFRNTGKEIDGKFNPRCRIESIIKRGG